MFAENLSEEQIAAIAKAVAKELANSEEFSDQLMDHFLNKLYLQTGRSFWKKIWSGVLLALAIIVAAMSGFKVEMPAWMSNIFK